MVQILSKFSLFAKSSIRLNIFNLRFKSTAISNFNYPVKNVEICTLKNFYNERPNGLKFNVEYCDTKEYVKKNDAPTILAIHGSPGTHNDFAPYMEKLSRAFEVRFVAPNFPAFEATDNYPMYLHKVEEKAIYLNDFLKKIDVNKVDMLITHSSGVYPSLYLWNNLVDMPDNRLSNIKSFTLFSPPGYRRIKAMRPKWFTQAIGDTYCTQIGRKIMRFIGPKVFKLAGVQLKLDNIDNLLVACVTMNNSKEHLLENHLKLIAKKGLPVFYSFSEDDRLIEKEVFYECLDLLNLNKKDLVLYNENAELSQLGDLTKPNKAIAFQKGGHYCFLKHHQIISNYVLDFFEENLIKSKLDNRISDLELNNLRPELESRISELDNLNLEQKQLKI